MLRSLCQLSAYSRVACTAFRPAAECGKVLTAARQYGFSSNLTRNILSCNNTSGIRQAPCLTLQSVSGLQPTLSSRLTLPVLPPTTAPSHRSVVKWSMRKGKRKSVKAVVKRFKRIHWGARGIWIRPRAAASKRMWKKSFAQRRRCKTHVFCNATQSQLLDKMVTRFWKKRRHYPNDPYAPYMRRENFSLTRGYPREFY